MMVRSALSFILGAGDRGLYPPLPWPLHPGSGWGQPVHSAANILFMNFKVLQCMNTHYTQGRFSLENRQCDPKKSLIEQSKWMHYAMCKNGRKSAENAENEMNDTPVCVQTVPGQDC